MDRIRRQSEIDFFNLFTNAEWSTENEDMFDHIDLKVGGVGIDVKGIKRYSMKDAEANPEIHWVEFQNVNGQKGWMYGKADYIAFELINEFLLIKREDLYNFCKEKIVDRKVKDTKGFYTLYRRKGCKDVLSLVLTEDLLKLPNKILRKDTIYDTEDFFQSNFIS